MRHRRGLYVDAATAQRAVVLVAPMIEAARRDARIIGSGFLYLVVMDPCALPGETPFAEAILHEQGFGDEARWDADYRRFARDKAQLVWHHGMDAHWRRICSKPATPRCGAASASTASSSRRAAPFPGTTNCSPAP